MIGSAGKQVATLGAAGLLALAYAAPATAASKVWVSNTGTDSGTCGAVASPCRTFQQAHDNVPAGGEIGVLTPGDYGQVIIRKSVNITNDGSGEAAILPPSGGGMFVAVGILIQAGSGDVVSLRGLDIDGQGIDSTGIDINQASAVHIQNCAIRNFEGVGVAISLSSNLKLFISDTLIYNNGTAGNTGGLLIDSHNSPTASAEVVLDRVRVENNLVGIKADGTGGAGNAFRILVRDSIVSGNAGNGIWSFRPTSGGASSAVLVNDTTVVNNAGAGVLADGAGVVLLSDSTVEYNGTGASISNGGRLFTYGNNLIDNNVGEDLSPAAIARTTK